MININVADLRDHSEKVWFLGTNILNENDLVCLNTSTNYKMADEFTTVACLYQGLSLIQLFDKLEQKGFSRDFIGLCLEARERGYAYLWFDCDIIT